MVAIYLVDSHPELNRGGPSFFSPLPDVAIYSKSDTRVSANAPASYNAMRIEFDQALDGTTVAGDNNALLGVETGPGGAGALTTFCKQSTSLKLRDLAADVDLPSSVCFDPSSTVGSNPHVTLFFGAETLGDPAASPFTCQTFDVSTGLKGGQQYALNFSASSIMGSNGKALVVPSGGNGGSWASGVYTFKTSGMELLGTYYIDPSTGYLVFLNKPSPGFLKDLDPDPAFQMLNTPDPILPTFSLPVNTDEDGNMVDDQGNPVTVTVTATGGSVGTTNIDPFWEFLGRQLEVQPEGSFFGVGSCGYTSGIGCTAAWEPGVEYKLHIPANMTGIDGAGKLFRLGTDVDYTFKVADTTSLGAVSSEPPDNQISVSPAAYSFTTLGGAQQQIEVQYPVPLDASQISGVTLKNSAGTAIDSTVSVDTKSRNGQVLVIKPNAKLTASGPGTPQRYTVSVTGLKTSSTVSAHAGAPVPDFSFSFTLAAFGISSLTERNAVFGSVRTHNVDRSVTQNPVLVLDGKLRLTFNDTPTNADGTTVHLQEVKADGSTVDVPTAVALASGTTGFNVTASDPNYAVKFNQRYNVAISTDVTSDQGIHASLEGCTPSATNTCADFRTFTTNAFGILPSADPTTGNLTIKFGHNDITRNPDRINAFTYEADGATLATSLPKAVKLYKQDPKTGALTQIDSSCTLPTADTLSVTCTPSAGLAADAPFQWSIVFTPDAPAKVAAKITEHINGAAKFGPVNADQSTGIFTGTKTVSFRTACQ